MAAKAVLDASALMAALLLGEPSWPAARRILERFAQGTLELSAPTLLTYEVTNALLKAERKPKRGIDSDVVEAILEELDALGIPVYGAPMAEVVATARRYGLWAYDASYLALAERQNVPLITSDRRLYNAVKERFDKITWVEDF